MNTCFSSQARQHVKHNKQSSRGRFQSSSATHCRSTTQMEEHGQIVHIDGSMLEGGGQILRNSAALAAITGQHLRVDKIRAGRSKPGLAAQHCTGLHLIAALSGAGLTGAEVKSSSIELRPHYLKAGSYEADTQTAGSCTLLAQAALPCAVFANPAAAGQPGCDSVTRLQLRGGTDASMAPPVSYLTDILQPTLRRLLGLDVTVSLIKRGFYPKGGGQVDVTAHALPAGQALPAFDLTTRGNVVRVTIRAFGAGRQPSGGAQRLADSAAAALRKALRAGLPEEPQLSVEVEALHEPPGRAVGDGWGLSMTAETSTGCLLGANAVGERGVTPDAAVTLCVQELMEVLTSRACVDQYMQDQLIIWAALAHGKSRMLCQEPTLHTRTAIEVAQTLTSARFRVGQLSGQQQGLWLIECEGAGHTGQ